MKRTLQLTSPLMKGREVEYATRLLVRHGYLGEISKTWGEDEAAGARRAKYMLGYPQTEIRGTFGTTLEKYLRGDAKTPAAYQKRRKKRLAAEETVGAKALSEAERWIGTKEKPAGSNRASPFTEWYGWHGWGAPWCAVFVSYCLEKAGFEHVKHFRKGDRWAFCPFFVNDARAGRHGLRVVSFENARPGDIVLFDWDNDGVADHIGFLKQKLPDGRFETVEGNTSPDNFSNGGKVVWYGDPKMPSAHPRSLADVVLIARAS